MRARATGLPALVPGLRLLSPPERLRAFLEQLAEDAEPPPGPRSPAWYVGAWRLGLLLRRGHKPVEREHAEIMLLAYLLHDPEFRRERRRAARRSRGA
jgi:hypothetical protein